MKPYIRLFASLLPAILIPAPLLAQTAPEAQTMTTSSSKVVAVNSFLIRMQRDEGGSIANDSVASCVIVYPDARAHYERREMNATLVFEGKLQQNNMTELASLIPGLHAIDPAKIEQKLQIDGPDRIAITYSSGNQLMNLQFQDVVQRRPFKAQMDPLLKWYGSVSGQHLARIDKAPDNCMPPGAVDITSQDTPAKLATTVASVASKSLLVRIAINTSDSSEPGRDLFEDKCLAVQPDGHYRFERSYQRLNEKPTIKIYEGSLPNEDLKKLQEIINAPNFVASKHKPDPPNGVRAVNQERVDVIVPRTDHVQELTFYTFIGVEQQVDNYLGTNRAFTDANVRNAQQSAVDNKIVNPLRGWMKNAVEKQLPPPLKNVNRNSCSF